MKKTYINPNIEVVKIASQMQIMAGSFTTNGDGDVTAGELIDENATGAGLSRSFDFDDDEDW